MLLKSSLMSIVVRDLSTCLGCQIALVWFRFLSKSIIKPITTSKKKTDQLLLFLAGIWKKENENGKELKSDTP